MDETTSSQSSSQGSLSCPVTEDEKPHPLIDCTLKYIKQHSDEPLDKSHFLKYLQEHRVRISETKALKQLKDFARDYFHGTALTKSVHQNPKSRYSPYNKESTRLQKPYTKDTDNVEPSTPPSPQPLRRASSFMDIEGGLPAIPANSPVQINVSFFNGLGGGPAMKVEEGYERHARYGDDALNTSYTMRIDVILPDDAKVKVNMSSQASVYDLCREVRIIMLNRYPLKRPEDLPLDRFHLKSRGGWELNLADKLSNVIHEGTVITCNYV